MGELFVGKKKKYYAVKKGHEVGVYETWEECKKNTDGYKGAQYKGFATSEEADQYMANNEYTEYKDKKESLDYEKMVSEALDTNRIVAFTDGSFDDKYKVAGYGVCILELQDNESNSYKKTVEHEISDIVRTERFLTSRNIGPEVMAVINAFDWTISKGHRKITIFHDYEGISKWAKKEWETRSEVSKWFVGKLEDMYSDLLDIEYIWVPAHSGVKYNENADRLAYEAVKSTSPVKYKLDETFFSCENVSKKNFLEIIKKIDNNPDINVSEENIENGIMYKLKMKKDKLTVTFFNKKSKTLIQGRPSSLFAMFISFYTEKIPDYEMVMAYGKMHRKKLEKKDIDIYMANMNLPNDFPEDIKKLIKQAKLEHTTLLKNRVESYDFGHYIFPACRALEGTIKYLFEKNGVHIKIKNNIGGYFDKNEEEIYYLKGNNYKDSVYKKKLEGCYNKYFTYRHLLGHFGELIINDSIESNTYFISEKEEATDILEEILNEMKFD